MTTAALGDKKLLGDEEAMLAERRAWVDEIEKLEAGQAKALPALTAAVVAAAERVEEAKAAHAEAVAEHRTAAGRVSAANLRFSRSRDLLEARLLETSAPELDAFIDEMKVEEARLQVSGNPSTIGARQARGAGLREGRRAAEELRLQALSHDELVERLDVIRNALDEVAA